MDTKERQAETIKLMNWICEYRSIARYLLDEDMSAKPDEYIRILENLDMQGLEYLLPIFMDKITITPVGGRAMQRLAAKNAMEAIERHGIKSFMDSLKGYIIEEDRL